MRTLRLLRNIGALFIMGTALAASRLEGGRKFCLTKLGYTACAITADGHCSDTKCAPGQPCADVGCVNVRCFFCF